MPFSRAEGEGGSGDGGMRGRNWCWSDLMASTAEEQVLVGIPKAVQCRSGTVGTFRSGK
jgi:hypothetical protein